MIKKMIVVGLLCFTSSHVTFANEGENTETAMVNQLPAEILSLIVQHGNLSPADLARNEQVCVRWLTVMRDPTTGWRRQIERISQPLANHFLAWRPFSEVLKAGMSQSWSQLLAQPFISQIARELGNNQNPENACKCLVAAELLGNDAIRGHLSELMVANRLRDLPKLLRPFIKEGSTIAKQFR